MKLIIDGDHYQKRSVNGIEKYVHRIVMEEHLGRPLLSTEVVHHKDRNPANNDINNLVLCKNQAEHIQLHVIEDCEHAGYDPKLYQWCSYHQQYELKESFGKHPARCKKGTNEYRKLKGLNTDKFDWKAKMHQQTRRAQKKGICSPLKEGSRL